MENKKIFIRAAVLLCSIFTLSACDQVKNGETTQHAISNSIHPENEQNQVATNYPVQSEKSSEEIVTSISGSIPITNSHSSKANDNKIEKISSQEQPVITATIISSTQNGEVQNDIPLVVGNTNDIVAEPISTDPEVNDLIETITKPTENNINAPSSEASPIAQTEFAKPEESTEEKNLSPADRILADILEKNAAIDYATISLNKDQKEKVVAFCKKINARLSSVSYQDCIAADHKLSPFNSVKGTPIVVTEFAPKKTRKPLGRVLIIGGTHGDELTSASTAYKWIDNLNRFHSGLFHWHIAPVINPDGLFPRPATRTNASGIDINRNLPTPDWEKQSLLRWEKSNKNPRRNPGEQAASEPETQWIMHEIETFKPDAIISIHAPYGVLDFDAPELRAAPSKFGKLKLNLLGTYPGSLGNYAGIEKEIPVLTLELPNAQYMPSQNEINAIWSDMITWLKKRLSE